MTRFSVGIWSVAPNADDASPIKTMTRKWRISLYENRANQPVRVADLTESPSPIKLGLAIWAQNLQGIGVDYRCQKYSFAKVSR